MAKHLSKHHRGTWKYVRRVPVELQEIMGAKFIRRYIPAMSKTEAENRAATFMLQDNGIFDALAAMTPTEAARMVADGGYERIRLLARFSPLFGPLKPIDPRQQAATLAAYQGPAKIAEWAGVSLATPAGQALMAQDFAALDTTLASAAATVARIEPATDEFSFDGLLTLYRDRVKPTRWDNHQRTVRELSEALGNMDYRHVTADDIATFRDKLGAKGKGYAWERGHLVRTSAMFSAAIDARTYKGANPCEGIRPFSREESQDKDTKGSFTGAQVRTILSTAAKVRFGDKRHSEALWVLHGLSFSGARPEEILLLQRGDVTTIDGIPVIEIRRTCCVTGERLPQKSIKNNQSRRTIPMHPALYDAAYQRKHGLPVASFMDFAKGDRTQFLFECFPWNATKYRRGWFDAEFGPFLKDDCGIVPDVGKKLSLTSLRNRFHDVMEHAGIGGVHERLIAGRAAPDVHEAYKRGRNLKALAESVAKVNPLSDD